MKTIVDIGFGRRTLYEAFASSVMSSRLQYGLVQLGNKYRILHESLERPTRKGTLLNNLKMLVSCDVLLMTYFYPQPFILLSLLRLVGFYRRRKLIVICHVSLIDGRNRVEKELLRLVYKSIDVFLFHSPKNMEESIAKGLVDRDHAEMLFWGDDLKYIDKNIHPKAGDFFLTTGREQRDFSMLISAFSKTNAVLELYTNITNYENDYSYLSNLSDSYPNVKIEFVEKDTATTRMLAQRASECLCVVIPLVKKEVYYCVGLTSLVEAMAMGKPIISSRNPYSPIDLEKEHIGIYADDETSWIKAVNYILEHRDEAAEMGRRARNLAEEKFNVCECAKQIQRIIDAH